MAFLENPQVEEQPQVQTPQVEEPPKKKKLWSGLQQKKLYTKSYEDFEVILQFEDVYQILQFL